MRWEVKFADEFDSEFELLDEVVQDEFENQLQREK